MYAYDLGMVGAEGAMIDAGSPDFPNPFEFGGEIGAFVPAVISKRMAEQEGVFTIQGDSLRDIRLTAASRLHRHDIDSGERTEILIDLFRLGICASTLFRDLRGLAETLRRVHEEYVPALSEEGGAQERSLAGASPLSGSKTNR